MHLSYYNSDGGTLDTPRTQLFLNRVIEIPEKVIGTSQGLRHVLSLVGDRRLIAKIPYAPSDPKLVEHSSEILAQQQVSNNSAIANSDKRRIQQLTEKLLKLDKEE